MRKTRDLFNKTRGTEGTIHAKMGTIKDRKGMDLTEAEDIKKRWQQYTEELYKRDIQDIDNHDSGFMELSSEKSCCSAGNNQVDEQAGIMQHRWQLSRR